MLVGCYAPSAPSSVPCDPLAPRCPTGQHCIASAVGFVCSSDAGDLPPDAAFLGDAGVDSVPIQRTYTATVAECVSPTTPDPQRCRELNGNAQLVLDLRDATTTEPWQAFVRFDLDDALAGRTVTKVVLRVVVTAASNAPGPDSGSVFEVQPFTLATLATTAPAKVGDALAGSVGAVTNGEVVTFTLADPSIANANSPVYLGLFANDEDGVNYYNRDGAMPPQLIVDAD